MVKNNTGNNRFQHKADELPPFCRLCGRELTAPENLNDEICVDSRKLDQAATILASKGHNNVAIIGKAGTGKTALVSALASEIVVGKYRTLIDRRVVEINIDTLLSDVHTVSEKGTRMQNLLKEAENAGIILFFDEGHRLCDNGDPNSLANILKPLLTHDKLQIVLATTIDEYQMFLARDPAFRRRFEAVAHNEPNAEETYKIVRHVANKRYPEISIGDNALHELISLGIKYLPERNNPDKSLALLDTLAAWDANHTNRGIITCGLVREVVAARINVPQSALAPNIKTGLCGMYEHLAQRFSGWENVCRKVEESLEKAQTRDLRSTGPLSATILCGSDSRLMMDIANAAAQKLGCVGEGAAHVIDVNRADPSDPYTACVQKNPHAAIIFHGINFAAPPEVLSRLRDVLCNGVLKDANNRSASYRYAHTFFLCEGEIRRSHTVGFGEYRTDDFRCDAAMEAVLSVIGANKEEVITVGAPDKAKITKIYNNIFIPLLAKSAQKCGCCARITLYESAKRKVFYILGDAAGWSNMHDVTEQIILAALSCGEVDKAAVGFEGGKFFADHASLKHAPILSDRSGEE